MDIFFLPKNKTYTFSEINILLQKKLPKDKILFKNKLYGADIKGRAFCGYELNNKIKNKKIEFSFIENPEVTIGSRIIADNNYLIKIICTYIRDNQDAGIGYDIGWYRYLLGDPIYIGKTPVQDYKNWFVVYENKKLNYYLMMGFYTKEIYYVAIFDKETIKDKNIP